MALTRPLIVAGVLLLCPVHSAPALGPVATGVSPEAAGSTAPALAPTGLTGQNEKASPAPVAQDSTALKRAAALFDEGRFREALDAYSQAHAENPRSAEALRGRARSRVRLSDFAGAIADYDKAIEIEPGNAGAWSARGSVKRRLKDAEGAWRDITKALEISPRHAGAHNNRGLLLYDRGDYTGAIADYTRAIELDPKGSPAFNNRGLAREKLNDAPGAEADYTRAIDNDPRNADAYANRGFCRARLGRRAEAVLDYQQAIAINAAHTFATAQLQKLGVPVAPPGPQSVSATAPPGPRPAAGAAPIPPAPAAGTRPPETAPDLDAPDPVAASATSDLAVGDVRVSFPSGWEQRAGSTAGGRRFTDVRPASAAAGAATIRIDAGATPYADTQDLIGILARREAAIARETGGGTPKRDEVILGGVPVTRWTWATPDRRTIFEYAPRNATSLFVVRAEAAGAVQVEPPAVREVLDTITIGGPPVDLDLERRPAAAQAADTEPAGREPPVWSLDRDASGRIAEPCGPAGEPAAEPPPPPPAPEVASDLEGLQATLAQSIDRLNRTRYDGAVAAAMQATRMLVGPLTPAQEQRLFAAWAPLFDYPSDNVIAYLEKLNPLLVEFVAMLQGVQAAEAGLEQAQYEAEMAAAYDNETGARAAMAAALRFAGELKDYGRRIGDVAARVAALGEPPDPMKAKCDARARTKKAVEFLKTLPPPPHPPAQTAAGDDLPPEFLARIPPSERPGFKGKGYWYWLTLPSREKPDTYRIQLDGFFHINEAVRHGGHDGFALGTGAGSSEAWWDGNTFRFSRTDPEYGSWSCPSPGSTTRAARDVVEGTISDDGRTIVKLEVTSTYLTCREYCSHGPERIDKGNGQHLHRLSGDDTFQLPDQETVYREFADLPLTSPTPMVLGTARRGASLEYSVRGPATRRHVRSLAPFAPTEFDATDKLSVRITSVEATAGSAATAQRTEDPAQAARREQIAFHEENIRVLEEDLARYSNLLSRATDDDSRRFYQYMVTSKTADLQGERDAITTIETGRFTRTMTAWDAMVQGQMAAQSREMAARTAAGASIYAHVDRLIDNLPEAERAKMRRRARDEIYGGGDRGENAKRVARSIAEQVRDASAGQARASLRDATWNDDIVANLEAVQTVANYSMYATPFIAGGGAVSLVYGMLSGTVAGYETGGYLGEQAAGTLEGTALSAVTTAARYWSAAIDYSLTFYEGYTAPDESGEAGGVSGGMLNVAETFVKRKIVAAGTKAVVGYQARLEAARKQARLDAWRDAQRRVAFQQEREYGKSLVEEHNRLYNQVKEARRNGASPVQVRQIQDRLMDTTAAIKQSPHAKGYLKFGADAAQQAAYASTERLHTAQVLREFKRDLEAEGVSLSGLRFKPIRNAGNTSPGMDLDMAVFTDLERIAIRDPKTGAVRQVPLYQANKKMQAVFDRTYARNSGGRSARASWQMVTTSKNLEAYEDMAWLRIKKVGREAGQVNPLRPGVKPIDPLSTLDPRYAAGAARVTEVKADEMGHQIGMSRDNRNWETYRGTSKDIKSKVLPLIAERLKDPKLSSSQRQQIMQRYEFYKRMSTSMDLANHDPVAAEQALKKLTGYQGADLVRMVSVGIESLGKFK